MVSRRSATRRVAGLAFGILAFALVLEITAPPGPGLDTDAMTYLGAAESMARHGALVVPGNDWHADSTSPLARFPPGYPVAIALASRAGMEPIEGARLVNAMAAFVTVATLVMLVCEATTLLVGLSFGAVLVVLPAMHEVHVSVLSEPLYLALTALALAAMVRRPERPGLTGAVAALAPLVRYVGVSVLVAAAIWAIWPAAGTRARLRRLAWALGPGVVALGLWVLRTSRVASMDSIRQVALYDGLSESLRQGVTAIAAWLVPDPRRWMPLLPHRALVAALIAGLVVLVMALGVRSLMRSRRMPANQADAHRARVELAWRLMLASAVMVGCYLAMLVTSRLLADPGIPFDQRLLSPVIVLATMAITVAAFHWWVGVSSMAPRIAVLGVGFAWWCAASMVTAGEARRVRREGSGYGTERWRRSDVIEWGRTAGTGHPLFSNRPPAVYFHLHRPVRDVPAVEDAARMQEFADRVRAENGRVLMFRTAASWFVTIDSLTRATTLRPVFEGASGVVLAPVDEPTPARRPRSALPSRRQ
jgi:hypothetical protein